MGSWLSGVLGTNSAVDTSNQSSYGAITPLQNQQNQLISQLQTQSAGGGPNPAQMQLQQNAQMLAQQQAQQNAQNRAINPGLAARMSGEQAANMGNTAVANSGIQQAQQQLASQQLLGNVINGGISGTNQASGINAGVAAGNQKAAQGIVGGILQGGGAALGLGLAHGGVVQNFDAGGLAGGMNFGNPSMSGFGMDAPVNALPAGAGQLNQPALGASMQPSSPSLGADTTFTDPSAGMMSDLGKASKGPSAMPRIDFGDPMASLQSFSKYYANGGRVSHRNPMVEMHEAGGEKKAAVPMPDRFSSGGKVPAMVSPGEGWLPPQKVGEVMKGRNPLTMAEKIPGRAPVKGDSKKNDIVPKTLDAGGVVIPRSIMESDDPAKKAAKFVADHVRKSKGTPEGEFKEALKRAISGRKSK